jgi:peptide/nickel transport system ATP-binding protein
MPRIDRPRAGARRSARSKNAVDRRKSSRSRPEGLFPGRDGRLSVRAHQDAARGRRRQPSISQGETLGIVGESGCGKSTLRARSSSSCRRPKASSCWCGRDLGPLRDRKSVRKLRKEFQIVFQDPLASLDPRMTIGQSIAEPLTSLQPELSRDQVTAKCAVMARVGLDPGWINRYPHEFSGGQNQRVGIARAMILKPKLLICDEAVSGLDVSIQSQIVDLILEAAGEFGMSMIFISHDLSVVRQVAHRVMVLYLGRVVELADRNTIYEDPRHPYTRALISAVPIPDPKAERAKARAAAARSALAARHARAAHLPEIEDDRRSRCGTIPPEAARSHAGHFVAEHDAA